MSTLQLTISSQQSDKYGTIDGGHPVVQWSRKDS